MSTVSLARRATALLTLLLAFGLALLPGSQAAMTTGSGGSFTNTTSRSFTASNGLTSQYHLYAEGVDPTRSVGLMVQFHGDGAYEFKNPNSSYFLGGTTGLREQAKSHNMILLVALAPDTQGEVTWWESGSVNADYARDLIKSVAFGRYDIDTERIWLVGYSGGAQFITQFLLPKHSSILGGGGSVVFGGGDAPAVTAQPFAADLRSDFPMHWYTGAEDTVGFNALRAAQRGSAYYANAGFPTTLETPAGVDHKLSGRFGPVTGQQLDIHDTMDEPQSPSSTPSQASGSTPSQASGSTPSLSQTATAWAHTIDPKAGATTLTVNVPAGTKRTTFRVSRSPIEDQVGTYLYTTRTGNGIKLTLTSLRAGRPYYYQIESGRDRHVVGSGTFVTY